MVRKLMKAAVVMGLLVPAVAWGQGTQQPRSSLNAEISTQLASGQQPPISATKLRQVLYDVVASASAIFSDSIVTLTGGLVVGPATGGSFGVGTVNVSGNYYINGVAVNTTPPTIVPPNLGPIYHLTDCMDTQYGVGNWTKRTGIGTGTDITPAVTACLAKLRTNFGRGTLYIDQGTWLMNNSPACADVSGNYIVGEDSISSIIFYNKTTGAALCWNGSGFFTGGGAKNLGIQLESGLGPTNSDAIYLTCANSSTCADQVEFENLYISSPSGTTYWYNVLHVDCTLRTAPQGCRVASLINLQLFNGSNTCAYISAAVQWTIVNLGCYTGKTPTGNDMYITGAGTSTTNSVRVSAIGLNVGGTLWVTNADSVTVEGRASQLTTAPSATALGGWLDTSTGLVGNVGVKFGVRLSNHNTAPSVVSCGSGPSNATGTDYDGAITEGVGATGCQFNFALPFYNTPYCSISTQQGAPSGLLLSTVTTSILAWTHAAASFTTVLWHCVGN